MAETTPNIGLKKPLGSEFVDIADLNSNMDRIDKAIGVIDDQLSKKPNQQISLTSGMQVIQGGDVPAILRPSIKGRTLVNLLGRVGNCGTTNDWTLYEVSNSKSLDTTYFNYGISGLRLTIANSMYSIGAAYTNVNVESGKHYIAISEIRNNDISGGVRVRIYGTTSLQDRLGITIGVGTSFQVSYRTYSATVAERVQIYGVFGQNVASANGQFATFDGVRFYEITAAEKSYIDGLTIVEAQTYIAANYPYVDDMKHVNAVYIENKGKNLLPPFSEWSLQDNGESTTVEAYKMVTTATANQRYRWYELEIVPNQVYTFSVTHNGKITAVTYDHFRTVLTNQGYQSNQFMTVTTESNAKYMRVFCSNDTLGAGTYTFLNPVLSIGSEALTFEPQKHSHLYLPDCNLRSNTDGSVSDRLHMDGQGKPRVTRRFREIVLDGTLMWTVVGDFSGFKSVSVSNLPQATAKVTGIKYDGKVLTHDKTGTEADSWGFSNVTTATVVLSISDTDSGWGESYTPTTEEIQAFFYGWRMQDGIGAPYAGTGQKSWRFYNVSGNIDPANAVFSVPKTMAGSGYSPYRLMYQLAQSMDEPVSYEGCLMLHVGDNQVEVGTGIVVREGYTLSSPNSGDTRWHVNSLTTGYPRLQNKTAKLLTFYKNHVPEKRFFIYKDNAFGLERAAILKTDADLSASYFVTYLALDTTVLGIAPQTINAEYAPNIRESVDSLVWELIEARTEMSILQNTKVQKQVPQWIEPTLLSMWARYDSNYATASYYKDDNSIVRVRGLIKAGVTAANTVLFYLPKGYRPNLNVSFVGVYGAAFTPIQIVITQAGAVMLGGTITTNSFLNIDGTFLAEQ